MVRFDSLQFRTLFVGEIRCHLPVHLRHCLVHAPAGLNSDLLELSGRVVDEWRNLRDLFRRELELHAQPLPHMLAHHAPMMLGKEEMPRLRRAEKCAGHAAGEKDEHQADSQLPF